jgi:large conductance mechanosensitive channel
VSDLLTPLIAAIAKVPDFAGLTLTLNSSVFMYGHFLNALIAFILVSVAVFFFVVKPMNILIARSRNETPSDPTTKKCKECLSEIPIEARRCSQCSELTN